MTMWHADVRRVWFRWEYEVYNSGFGLVVGRTWTKRSAERRISEAVAELVRAAP